MDTAERTKLSGILSGSGGSGSGGAKSTTVPARAH
jgi:hypothetical protein